MKRIVMICAAVFLISGATATIARAQSAAEYDRRIRAAVQKLTKEIKATASGKYLVRFETSDATTALYFKPNKVLWRKLSDAERIEITADWWRRWMKIPKSDETMTELQSLDGQKDVYCSPAENGVDPVCSN